MYKLILFMKDNFDKFEEKLYNFFTSMSLTKYIISKVIILWLLFSFIVTLMLAYVGANIVDAKMLENYTNGTLSLDGYNMWNDVLVKVILCNLKTIEIVMFIVFIGWLCFILYPIIKYYYKRN
jgi:hypothetical protein